MKAVHRFLSFSAIALLAGTITVTAQTTNDGTAKTPTEQNTQTAPLVSSPNESAVATNEQNFYRNGMGERYRIGFLDTLEVQVARHPELSAPATSVSPDGTIFLPRIKQPIVAVCKTESELREIITAHLKTVLKDPFVNVRAVDQRSQPFAVVGAVQKPGRFYISQKVSLLELLAYAGGPDVENAGSRIQVARGGNTNGCVDTANAAEKEIEFQSYNLNDVLKGKSNPLMQPGDIVSVLIAEEAYVVGDVIKPTKISLREEMTLQRAIAEAGGTEKTAKVEKVIIQRKDGASGNKTELVYNLKDIRDGKIPDPQIQGNDIVVVASDRVKSVLKDVKEIIKNGLPTAFYRF